MGYPNPLLDYSIKDMFFVIDGFQDTEQNVELVDHVVALVTAANFYYVGWSDHTSEEIMELSSRINIDPKTEFEKDFSEIESRLDLELLISYAKKANPLLAEELQKNPSDVKGVLWREYQKRFDNGDSIYFETLRQLLTPDYISKPNTHLVFIAMNHHLPASNLHTRGRINYHTMGRGFYSYGFNIPVRDEGRERYRHIIALTLFPVKDESMERKKAWISETFYHEVRGHMLGGLDDHHDANGGLCVMTTRPSATELIEVSMKRKTDYFCKPCLDKLGIFKEGI